jgi:hypothetical protein
MVSHRILACEGHSWCSGGHLNATGLLLLCGTFIVIVAVAAVINSLRKKAGMPPLGSQPRGPLSNMSPFAADLLTGKRHQAYFARVSALTPGGIRVTQARCCTRGHLSPKQAVDHADAIRRRIEKTGR